MPTRRAVSWRALKGASREGLMREGASPFSVHTRQDISATSSSGLSSCSGNTPPFTPSAPVQETQHLSHPTSAPAQSARSLGTSAPAGAELGLLAPSALVQTSQPPDTPVQPLYSQPSPWAPFAVVQATRPLDTLDSPSSGVVPRHPQLLFRQPSPKTPSQLLSRRPGP